MGRKGAAFATHSNIRKHMQNKTVTINTNGKGFYLLDRHVDKFLKEAGAKDGLLNIFIKHTSASLAITENYDPSVKEDLLAFLEKIAPEGNFYKHSLEGPDDMPAHIKNMSLPTSLSIPVLGGKMQLGTWQSVYLVEHKVARQVRRLVLSYL